MIDHISISSSFLASAGYSESERILEITYRTGVIYRYYDVPVGIYRELLKSQSKGNYYNQHIAKVFSTSPIATVLGICRPQFKSDGLKEFLAKYVPIKAVDAVAQMIIGRHVQIVATRARRTKLGDYSNPRRYGFHKITINHNLNQYRFLVTLLHELAHLDTWNEYRNEVLPHGPEWKEYFKRLVVPFIESKVFPEELAATLQTHLRNPSYASCVDHDLQKALRVFDSEKSGALLEELPLASVFKMKNGMVLRKGERFRKRFVCKSLDSRYIYRVDALVEVVPMDEPPDLNSHQSVPDSLDLFTKACRWNKVELVKQILNRGIDVNQILPNGKTALQIAHESEHTDLISFLISQGAMPQSNLDLKFK